MTAAPGFGTAFAREGESRTISQAPASRRFLSVKLDSNGNAVTQRPKPQRRGSWTWMIFAFAAVAVLAYGVYQSREENKSEPTSMPPTSAAGGNSLINITQALQAQGLKVEIIRSSFRSPQLTVPGQGLSFDGDKVYIFIYNGADAVALREADSKDLDPATLTVLTVSGTPVAGTHPHVVSNSNVIAVLSSSDEELTAKVDAAIQGLP